jgi:WD40 repeat protein
LPSLAHTAGGLRLVQGAFLLSSHVLTKDPSQLRGQLTGRLLGYNTPEISSFLDRATQGRVNPWLRPLSATLTQSGGPFRCAFTGYFSARTIAITADGRYAVACFSDTIKVFDLDTGREHLSLRGHRADVVAVAAIGQFPGALSFSEDGIMMTWDLENGDKTQADLDMSYFLEEGGFPISFSEDGNKYVVHSGDTLKEINAETGQELCAIGVGPGFVAAACDGRRAISCFNPNASMRGELSGMIVWDLENGQKLRTLEGHKGRIRGVSLSPDGRWAVSSSDDGTIRVWDVASGSTMAVLRGKTGTYREESVAISADGGRVVSCTHSELRAWDLTLGEGVRILSGHDQEVQKIALSPDGRKIVSAASEELKVWDLTTGKILKSVAVKGSSISALAVTPDGRSAISIWSRAFNWDHLDLANKAAESQKRGIQGVVIVDLAGNEKSRLISTDSDLIGVLAVSPDGNWAVSGSGCLYKWDIGTGKKDDDFVELTQLDDSGWNAAAMTRDGRHVVSSAGSSYEDVPIIYLWDLERGEVLRTFEGHERCINDIAISPDGRLIVSA